MQVLEGLERIPGIIREHGWTKGRMMNEEGEVCVVGAARLAFDIPVTGYKSRKEAADAASLNEAIKLMAECAHKRTQQGLLLFNDSPKTTEADVLEVVYCAIDKARGTVREAAPFVFLFFARH